MLLFLLACGGPATEVDFGDPALLVPLEDDNRAPATDGPVVFVSGFDEAADQYWTHARSRIEADTSAVWLALRDLDVMADRRAVDTYSLADEGHLPEFDFSFVVANETVEIITLRFDLTWVHELQAGTMEAPEHVLARWDKTDGTPFIDRLSGSVELVDVDGSTELRGISQLRASGRDATGMEQYWQDLHADLVAHVNDAPLPSVE